MSAPTRMGDLLDRLGATLDAERAAPAAAPLHPSTARAVSAAVLSEFLRIAYDASVCDYRSERDRAQLAAALRALARAVEAGERPRTT